MSHRRKLWIVSAVVVGAVALGFLGFTLRKAGRACAFARLPVRAQNLAVFDAARTLLESNYYTPELFRRAEWPEFKRQWREQAAASRGGGLLYVNVLQNFAARFPSSHVYLVPPPRASGAAAGLRRKPTAADERFAALFVGGPGFDQEHIRRGETLLDVVGEVVRGSPAERAGIAPGCALKDFAINGDGVDVHFRGTFCTLDPAAAERHERTGAPVDPNVPTMVAAYDYEMLTAREGFELRRLVNGATYLRFDTASSAEITAAALQDFERGAVIGRGTNGAVLSGQFFDLPDGAKLAVPVADYERKGGKRIEGIGVQPDIWVLPSLEDVRAGRDPVLGRAALQPHREPAAARRGSPRAGAGCRAGFPPSRARG